jgi:hypothetical protein
MIWILTVCCISYVVVNLSLFVVICTARQGFLFCNKVIINIYFGPLVAKCLGSLTSPQAWGELESHYLPQMLKFPYTYQTVLRISSLYPYELSPQLVLYHDITDKLLIVTINTNTPNIWYIFWNTFQLKTRNKL